MSKQPKISMVKTAAFMAILTLVSKCIGFLREIVMANYYGTGTVNDAYVMAENIPNYLLAALVSAVGAAYMPTFSRKYELEGPEEANRFTSSLINMLVTVCCAIVVIGEIFAGNIVKLFAPGYSAEAQALTTVFLRMMFAVAVLGIFITIFGAYLQYRGCFLPQIIFGYIQSISIIAVILISVRTTYLILPLGLIIGYLLRSVFSIKLAHDNGYRYVPDFSFGPAIKEIAIMAVPVFIGGYVSQINSFIDKILASNLAGGSVSSLNYAYLVLGVITELTVTVIATIAYPKFNQAVALRQYDRLSETSESAINLAAIITIPFTFGCILYSEDAIQVLFERGAFDEAATALTGTALRFYAITLFFAGTARIITYIFYSMKDMKSSLYCSLVSVAVNITLNLLLVKRLGVAGLALATGLASIVNCVLLFFVFRRKNSGIRLLRSKRKLLLMVLFSAVSVGASYVFYIFAAPYISIARMVRLGLAVLLAAGVYLLLLYLARFDELQLLRGLVSKGRKESTNDVQDSGN